MNEIIKISDTENEIIIKLEKYANLIENYIIESNLKSKYYEALDYINNVISNKDNFDINVGKYAEYLLDYFTYRLKLNYNNESKN